MLVRSRGVTWDRGGKARVLSVLGRAGVVLGVILGTITPFNGVGAWLVFAALVSWFFGFVISLDAPREIPGEVHVDEHGNLQVSLAKKRVRTVARDRVRGAWVVRRLINMREYHWVEIATRSLAVVSVRVDNDAEGRALVDALGFGNPGRAVAIPLAKRNRRLVHIVLLGVAYLPVVFVSAPIGPIAFLALPILYELLRFLFRPPLLEVGQDGLRVGRARVRREEVARVVFFAPSSLIVEKKDGKKLRVFPMALDPVRIAAAAEIVDARLGDRPPPARANAFERAGRGLAEWRAGLLTSLDPSYRTSGATVDDAATVLASQTATVEQRIGAALALRVAGEPLERVRVAAEGTVDPKVRVVLDAIADGADDERVDETLRALQR